MNANTGHRAKWALRRYAASVATMALLGALAMGFSANSVQAAQPCSAGFFAVAGNGASGTLYHYGVSGNTYAAVGGPGQNLVGIGLNPSDNTIYGVSGSNLFTVDATGTQTLLGAISGTSGRDGGGDFYNGQLLWVPRNTNSWSSINVATRVATRFTLSPGSIGSAQPATWGATDLTVIGDFAYGLNGSKLYVIDLVKRTSAVASISGAAQGEYQAAYSDAAGNAYFFNAGSSTMYELTWAALARVRSGGDRAIAQPIGSRVSGLAGTFIDGASCPASLSPYSPSVSISDITGISNTAAIVNGSINNNFDLGGISSVRAYVSTDPAFGTKSTFAAAPYSTASGSSQYVAVTASVTGLGQATTYYVRLVATNGSGTVMTNPITFTTNSAPVAATLAATDISSNSVVLHGVVDNSRSSTPAVVTFCVSISANMSNCRRVTAAESPVAPRGQTAVSVFVGGLGQNTKFYAQVTANDGDSTTGAVITFATTTAAVVVTLPATGVGPTTATLNGTVDNRNSNQSANVSFCYGTQPSLTGCTPVSAAPSAIGGTGARAVATQIANLSPGTTYYFAVSAQNSSMVTGSVRTFTTAKASTSGRSLVGTR